MIGLRNTASWLLVGVAMASTGCAQQLKRIDTRVAEVQQTQQSMERRQLDTLAEIERLRESLGDDSVQGRQRGAEVGNRLDALERALRQMMANWEEQQVMLRRMQSTLDILQLGRGGMPSRGVPAGGEDDLGESGETAGIPAADVTGGVGAGSAGTEVFDAAFADFTRGNYSLARDGFEEFLARYPDSAVADEAAYWVAETYYSQGNYQEARRRFDAVLQREADDDTLAKCLLKLGYCLLELDREEQAIEHFRRLRRDYPDSDEALIAEHKLTTLRP